jgi:hypothetical protein
LFVSTAAAVSIGGTTTARRRRDGERAAVASTTASPVAFLRDLVRVDTVAGTTASAATAGVASRARRARARAGRVSSAVPRSTEALGPVQACGAASRKTVSVTPGTYTPSLPALRFAIV